ncbi:MAG: EI24 domain-containing protein [Pseudomonadota bacterium]
MIIPALQAALAQLPDPRFRRVLIRAIGITFATLVAVSAALGFAVSLIGDVSLPLFGAVDLGATLGVLAGLGAVIASAFLMIPVAAMVIGFFLEDIAKAVEEEHYPHLTAAAGVPFFSAVLDSLRLFGVVILANLVALIFYLLFAPLAPFLFYGLNGFLLGREYFSLVALRRLSAREVSALRRRHRLSIWALGVILAIPLSVPLLGLIVPLIGVAAYTHFFHLLQPQPGNPASR